MVCVNGMPPSNDNKCEGKQNELYWTKSKPSATKMMTKEMWINPATGLPPAFGQTIDGLVLETHTFYQDPVTDLYCLDCNRPLTPEGKPVYEQTTIPETVDYRYSFEQKNSDHQSTTNH